MIRQAEASDLPAVLTLLSGMPGVPGSALLCSAGRYTKSTTAREGFRR